MNAALLASERMTWNTPHALLAPVRAFAGAEGIGLDPCSNADSIVNATTEWHGAHSSDAPCEACTFMPGAPEGARAPSCRDGLVESWRGRGLAYMNPPYGREIVAWVEKARLESESNGVEVVGLVPARTDARWWQEHVTQAAAICFWKGRLKFVGAPASAPFPSAVIYWRPNDLDRTRRSLDFLEAFRDRGWVVVQ